MSDDDNDDEDEEEEEEDASERLEEETETYSGYRRITSGTIGITLVVLGAILLYLESIMAAAVGFNIFGGVPIGTVVAVIGVALILLTPIKVNSPYQKTVVLRLGKFVRMAEQGLYYILPLIETGLRVDTRINTSTFVAEQTLTKDNVPVDVDAVIFWNIKEPKKAVLDVVDFFESIKKASMTALRDAIGKTDLAQMITEREGLDVKLKTAIDQKAQRWGLDVDKVEIKEIKIPKSLQDAMSRQAQAERERQARLILGDSEVQIAKKFEEAAKVYRNNPEALHLRGMNMLFEGLKQTDTVVIVPSSAVQTMGFGNTLSMANASQLTRARRHPKTEAPRKKVR